MIEFEQIKGSRVGWGKPHPPAPSPCDGEGEISAFDGACRFLWMWSIEILNP